MKTLIRRLSRGVNRSDPEGGGGVEEVRTAAARVGGDEMEQQRDGVCLSA